MWRWPVPNSPQAEGDLAMMEGCADEAEQLARPVAHAVALAGARRFRAAAAAARGELRVARSCRPMPVGQYESMDSPHWSLDVRTELAALQWLEGDPMLHRRGAGGARGGAAGSLSTWRCCR
jgi:hypothetical protein